MIFNGISKTFSTKNNGQFETIGAFWDELSKKYGRENLRGLGYNWTADTIEYVIGLKNGDIDGANCSVTLPDDWTIVRDQVNLSPLRSSKPVPVGLQLRSRSSKPVPVGLQLRSSKPVPIELQLHSPLHFLILIPWQMQSTIQ